MITFNDYLAMVSSAKVDHPEWRMGQTYFNVLYITHPAFADSFRSGKFDPFYLDDRIGSFLKLVSERWPGY